MLKGVIKITLLILINFCAYSQLKTNDLPIEDFNILKKYILEHKGTITFKELDTKISLNNKKDEIRFESLKEVSIGYPASNKDDKSVFVKGVNEFTGIINFILKNKKGNVVLKDQSKSTNKPINYNTELQKVNSAIYMIKDGMLIKNLTITNVDTIPHIISLKIIDNKTVLLKSDGHIIMYRILAEGGLQDPYHYISFENGQFVRNAVPLDELSLDVNQSLNNMMGNDLKFVRIEGDKIIFRNRVPLRWGSAEVVHSLIAVKPYNIEKH